jgi:chromosome segregation ATPase
LEASNHWADSVNRQLGESGERVVQLQDELADEQRAARETITEYESKVADLEKGNREKVEWALETERRLGAELDQARQELAKCVALLDTAERTVEERTNWALSLDRRIQELEAQLGQVQASRWIRLGRVMGLGPELGKR